MEKQELKIEDLTAGNELVCIDRDGFAGCNVKFNTPLMNLDKLLVASVSDHVVYLSNENSDISRSNCCIFASELKYFKKKEEQPQKYTFDDLIDITRKAYDDGVLHGYALENKLVKSLSIKFSDTKVSTWILGDDDYSIPASHIQSLYKETFVIETEDDFNKIKNKAKGTLLNGNRFTVEGLTHSSVYGGLLEVHADFTNRKDRLSFLSVKGATVEQPK